MQVLSVTENQQSEDSGRPHHTTTLRQAPNQITSVGGLYGRLAVFVQIILKKTPSKSFTDTYRIHAILIEVEATVNKIPRTYEERKTQHLDHQQH